jgi:hypothetical protein
MMHSLQRMDAAMERFMGAKENPASEILADGETRPTEPPDLQPGAMYQRLCDRSEQFDLDTYARLNSIWKQIFKFTKAFVVTATAGPAELKRYPGDPDDEDSRSMTEEIVFSIHLESELFTADVQLSYMNDMNVRYENEKVRWIEYSSTNMQFKRKETGLIPIVFYERKMLFDSVTRRITPYNPEKENMDALFVAYDVLSSLQRVLKYNKMLSVVKSLSSHQAPSMPADLPDTAKDTIFAETRKQTEEVAARLLVSLLQQCRPGFLPGMSLIDARSNNLTGGLELEQPDPFGNALWPD